MKSALAHVRALPRDRHSRWITVKEAAAYLGVHPETIYEMCQKRGLRHAKLGRGTIRLCVEWIDAWVEAQS